LTKEGMERIDSIRLARLTNLDTKRKGCNVGTVYSCPISSRWSSCHILLSIFISMYLFFFVVVTLASQN